MRECVSVRVRECASVRVHECAGALLVDVGVFNRKRE